MNPALSPRPQITGSGVRPLVHDSTPEFSLPLQLNVSSHRIRQRVECELRLTSR